MIEGELMIAFTIGCCPQFIYHTTWTSNPYPRIVRSHDWALFTVSVFFSGFFYVFDFFFLSNIYLSVNIALITHWKEYFHNTSLSMIPYLLGPRKASQPFYIVKTRMTLRRVIIFVLNTHRLELFVKGLFWVTIRKFVVTFVWPKCHVSHFFRYETWLAASNVRELLPFGTATYFRWNIPFSNDSFRVWSRFF